MRMKQYLVLFTLFIIISGALVHGIDETCGTPCPTPGEQPEKAKKSFLWRVETPAGSSYLMGSIHFLKKEHYPLPKAMEDAFANTAVLAVEADVSAANQAKEGMALMKKGLFEGEDTLQKNISKETYEATAKRLKALGLDISAFSKFKPWMLSLTIVGMEMMKLGYLPSHGLDKYFLDKAVGKKEIKELEGVEFQLKLFDGLTKEENEKLLLSCVLQAEKMAKEIGIMFNAWSTGDTEALSSWVSKNLAEYPELEAFNKKLLDDRNSGMVKKIVQYFKMGKTFLVVAGAAHMVGETGIIRQLESRGYKLTQL